MVTFPAVPCLDGAGAFPPAPNLGLIEVPALEPIDILLRLGSIFKIFVIIVHLNIQTYEFKTKIIS
jgi:hypothetical protein